jgi:hypothetical protein
MQATTSFLNSTLFLHPRTTSVDDYALWMMTTNPPPQEEKEEPATRFRYVSSKADSLFWCIYAIHQQTNIRETRATEIEEKLAAVKWITENKPHFHLSAASVQKYTAELMSSPKTTWGSLFLLCQYYKVNVRVSPAGRNMYMDFLHGGGDHLYQIIRQDDGTTFRVDGWATDADDAGKISQDFRDAKPLRGIGSYKVDDLKALADRLGLSSSSKQTKQTLYDAVYQALSW